MRTGSLLAIGFCGATLAGCATITQGTSQSIAITTLPAVGANCTLTGREGTWYVTTPGVANVQKSKEDIAIQCNKDGWRNASAVIPASFQGWTLGNVLAGGLVGVVVDASSGAMNKYPHAFQVPMIPMAGTTVPASGATQVAANYIDSQPHLDTSGVNMQPNYPATALPARESGYVSIRAFVRDDGTVKKISLERTSGYDDLDSAAANAVMHWKFIPAMQGGQPVSGEAVVGVNFQPPA